MSLYPHLGVAVAFSPRLRNLLAEAAAHWPRFSEKVSLLHAGPHSPEKEEALRDALRDAGLPIDTAIHWSPSGSPADAILRMVDQHQIDLLLAGALERERPLRYYLGSVAHNLVRHSPCSLLLLTEPSAEPKPFRDIVVVTDYSEAAAVAFARVLRFTVQNGADAVHVVRVLSQYGEAMILSEGVRRAHAEAYHARTKAEEKSLLADFVASAGVQGAPVEPHVLEGRTGVVIAQFVRETKADLLVMPSSSQTSHFFERLFPSDMEWVLREIPCNLWVARERL